MSHQVIPFHHSNLFVLLPILVKYLCQKWHAQPVTHKLHTPQNGIALDVSQYKIINLLKTLRFLVFYLSSSPSPFPSLPFHHPPSSSFSSYSFSSFSSFSFFSSSSLLCAWFLSVNFLDDNVLLSYQKIRQPCRKRRTMEEHHRGRGRKIVRAWGTGNFQWDCIS